jgi:signal peptidase I
MERKLLFKICLAACIVLSSILGVVGVPVVGAVILAPIQRTDYPLLTVASESMIPTLHVGDMIIVQGGLSGTDISADYVDGDVIVFHNPRDRSDLIVHRAVEKHVDGETYFRTKGDHNPTLDYWIVLESDVVGKVTGIIPYLGHLILFLGTTEGLAIFVLLVVAIIGLGLASIVLYVAGKTEAKRRAAWESENIEPELSHTPTGVYCRFQVVQQTWRDH